MRRAGRDVGLDQAARLMCLAGVRGVVRGRKPRTTIPTTVRTDALPLGALGHALLSAEDQALHGLGRHSDRGSQYVSIRYTQHLAKAGLTGSVGTAGDAYDNALAESVKGLCKTELIYAGPVWPSATEVEFETMNRVHRWSTTRVHEALGYQTPAKVEAS